MTSSTPSSNKKGSVRYRHRILKFAIVIGLHAGLAALLLYVSLNNPDQMVAAHSIKVSLLKAPQSIQPPDQPSPTQPVPKAQMAAPRPPQNRQQQITKPGEPSTPKPASPPISNLNAASASPSTGVTAPAAAPNREEPSPAQIPVPSAGDASSASADCPYRPSPAYPDTINGKNEKGDVQLSISITAKGKIDAVDIRKSSGFPILDETARNTVLEKWRCVPAHQNGKDVAARVGVLIQFVVK